MGAVVETPSIYLDLSAEENLKMQYRTLGLPSYSGIPELLKLVGLSDTGRKKAKNFSLGMRQRLGIAVALAGDPDFLVLDEPVNGLDPQGIIEMRELILKLNRERQITVLISSHILDELSRLATHYGFLDHGAMVRELSAQELEEALLSCYGALHQRGITPALSLPDRPVRRTLDPEALSRILHNILSNALKYSDGDLSVTMTEEGVITFRNAAQHLTPIAVGRLFDRYYTVESAQSSTGLGLSIAKALSERMGGRISAAYEDGNLEIRLAFP